MFSWLLCGYCRLRRFAGLARTSQFDGCLLECKLRAVRQQSKAFRQSSVGNLGNQAAIFTYHENHLSTVGAFIMATSNKCIKTFQSVNQTGIKQFVERPINL